MTSNNTPSPYVITASHNYSSSGSYDMWQSFKNPDSTPGTYDCWCSYPVVPTQNNPVWLQLDLGEGNSKRFIKVGLRPRADNGPALLPTKFTIKASNDGSSFVDLATFDKTDWASNTKYEFRFANSNYYRYYRIVCYGISSGDSCIIGRIWYKCEAEGQGIAPSNVAHYFKNITIGDCILQEYIKDI